MLKSFFGWADRDEIQESAIKRFDPDKFKPLHNFLKKGIKTDEKNIELLAWMIDFPRRPYLKYQYGSGSHVEANTTPVVKEERTFRKEVILEYPSGVKLLVDASDFSLIAQLVRL